MDKKLYQYFSGELTADERLELIHRIENDGQLKAEFIRLQNLTAVSQLSSRPTDRNEGKSHFKAFTNQIERNIRRKFFISFAKYAAIALILITATVWTTLHLSDIVIDSTMNTLYVPAGQRAQITLQDGTEVWLNAQSTLVYPSHFSKKSRTVEITGEAFFDVAQEKKRPFIVSTQHINMEVLGTQFNVYSYPDAGYIQTALVEGSLRICEKQNGKNAILLAPNEQMTLKESKMSITPISNPDHLLWRKGIYSFDNERLIDIIKKLELYYDVTIKVEDPEIFNVRYTGKFRQRDGIDEILHLIQKIQPFKIERDRDNNIITLTK
ncbi:MAG: FecR domain-containing protein [Proteiniphilum sp.]|uniref:FecR family protein n=1 Tax=Proteiniphilum sp. TaxID=1926877 RepID=UPI002AB89A7B|nr:FecR domain-containing protein [Proteiniphilum sp.]MDY9919050.1 FecR domain-containing protein [Proteiniphilum sp.]